MNKLEQPVGQPTGHIRPLWRCPACSRFFANRNQTHTCGRHTLRSHFEGRSREVKALYQRFVALVRQCGPVRVVPEKSRIAFQARMSFAAVALRNTHIVGHLVLASPQSHCCFRRIDTISRRNHVHHFVLYRTTDLTEAFAGFIRDAYAVGEQKHLKDA